MVIYFGILMCKRSYVVAIAKKFLFICKMPVNFRQFRRAMRRMPLRTHDRHFPRGYRRPDNAPRGRMSAYAFFIQTCREEFKQSNPGESIVFKEFSKKCAQRWKVRFTQNIGNLLSNVILFEFKINSSRLINGRV